MMGEVSCSFNIKDVYSESIYPLDSRILVVPLNEEESQCWMELKDLATGCHRVLFDELGEAPIELDHPVVAVLSGFAIAAFNELGKMYVKRDEGENIYEAEVLNVRYSPNSLGYLFFITLEAMEEDVAGVYEAAVLCNYDDGRRTLIKFIRSSRAPVGKKFKGMKDLIRDKFVYQFVKEQKKEIKGQLLKIRCNAQKGKKRSKLSADFIRLKKDYKVVKGAFGVFDKYAHRLKPISWKIKKTNPDYWFIPNEITGLQPRGVEHPCGGYDYQNPLTVFSCCT